MFLSPIKIPIKSGNKFIAVLNEKTALKMDLRPQDRILIRNGSRGQILRALVEITESQEIKENQVGLYIEPWERLKTKRGDKISVKLAEKPISLNFIRQKLDGEILDKNKLNEIIKDIVEDDLAESEIAYFVSGCYTRGLSEDETVALTKAVVENGGRLSFGDKMVLDKHCVGGVPGNRTTLIVVPIITALGLCMPKTSSRAITSPAGTADTMETLANVVIPSHKLKKIVEKVGGFIAWGGGVDLAPADDKIIKARNILSLDPKGMVLASILSKKYSVSATHVLIDIPVGPQIKIKDKKSAEILAKDFKKIGKKLGMKIEVIITQGIEPIGSGIGPNLEAIDVMKVLKNDPTAPKDLREKSIEMAARLLKLSGRVSLLWSGKRLAEKVLKSGKAYEQMMRIIKAQGEIKKELRAGKFSRDVVALSAGKVVAIDNKLVASIARCAGAPKDPESGLFIYKKIGNKVRKGEKLFTIYSDSKELLQFSEHYDLNKVYTIK